MESATLTNPHKMTLLALQSKVDTDPGILNHGACRPVHISTAYEAHLLCPISHAYRKTKGLYND